MPRYNQHSRKGDDVVSAATITLPALGDRFDITGTTGISAVAASGRSVGARAFLRFADAVEITHNATSLALLDGIDYTTLAGDLLVVEKIGTDAQDYWREIARHTARGGVRVIEEAVAFGNFTDDGGLSGHVDLAVQLPAGAIPLGATYEVATGFTGDGSATVQAGVAGDEDRFASVIDQSVFAAATVGHGVAPDAADGIDAAQTLRITVTGGADFTSISAGAMTVRVAYIQL